MFRARMQREADAAGRLTEPHVVPIHDYGEIDGSAVPGHAAGRRHQLGDPVLKRTGPMSPPRAVAIVRQVAAALDAAHAGGVTHRDVKPENILITGDDFAYLVDFGIARAGTDPGLTQAGMAMGTYKYMAPPLQASWLPHRSAWRNSSYPISAGSPRRWETASPQRNDPAKAGAPIRSHRVDIPRPFRKGGYP